MKKIVGWSVVAIVVLAFIAGDMTPEEQKQDRRDIEACWDAVDDDLQELSTRRLMREGCELLEAQYEERWR